MNTAPEVVADLAILMMCTGTIFIEKNYVVLLQNKKTVALCSIAHVIGSLAFLRYVCMLQSLAANLWHLAWP